MQPPPRPAAQAHLLARLPGSPAEGFEQEVPHQPKVEGARQALDQALTALGIVCHCIIRPCGQRGREGHEGQRRGVHCRCRQLGRRRMRIARAALILLAQ